MDIICKQAVYIINILYSYQSVDVMVLLTVLYTLCRHMDSCRTNCIIINVRLYLFYR